MKLVNCMNCGAILHSNKCDYCGTEYDLEKKISVLEQDGDEDIVLNIYGKRVHFYIGDISFQSIGNIATLIRKNFVKVNLISKGCIEDCEDEERRIISI